MPFSREDVANLWQIIVNQFRRIALRNNHSYGTIPTIHGSFVSESIFEPKKVNDLL